MNLDAIHNANYIHKDLHCGNILQFGVYHKNANKLLTKITDLGNAQLINLVQDFLILQMFLEYFHI